jgi:hypothetical protein
MLPQNLVWDAALSCLLPKVAAVFRLPSCSVARHLLGSPLIDSDGWLWKHSLPMFLRVASLPAGVLPMSH